MIPLYQNIKERRLALHISQDELAKQTGYSDRSSIAKIESGKVDLSQSKISMFAKALNCSPAYLMGWTNDPALSEKQFQEFIEKRVSFTTTDKLDETLLKFFSDELSSTDENVLVFIDNTAFELLKSFRILNLEGKNKVKEYATDLAENEKYINRALSNELNK